MTADAAPSPVDRAAALHADICNDYEDGDDAARLQPWQQHFCDVQQRIAEAGLDSSEQCLEMWWTDIACAIDRVEAAVLWTSPVGTLDRAQVEHQTGLSLDATYRSKRRLDLPTAAHPPSRCSARSW